MARKADPLDRNQLTLLSTIDVDVPDELMTLKRNADKCTRCKHHKGRKQAVFSSGPHNADMMVIGEAPGREEDKEGYPFAGKSGADIDKILEALGLDRQSVYCCNALKCRPIAPDGGNDSPSTSAIKSCLPFLQRQIELVQPKVIVAVGGSALKALMGNNVGGIMKTAGEVMYYKDIPVVPTLHPAFFMRPMPVVFRQQKKKESWEHWQKAKSIMDLDPKDVPKVDDSFGEDKE